MFVVDILPLQGKAIGWAVLGGTDIFQRVRSRPLYEVVDVTLFPKRRRRGRGSDR